MSVNPSSSLDAIFWVGNTAGATVVNYTTGRTYALITKSTGVYDVRIFLSWLDRLRFLRRMQSFELTHMAWLTFAYMEMAFDSMLDAITETDQTLEALGVLPPRVEPWERYYLLRADAIWCQSQPQQEKHHGL